MERQTCYPCSDDRAFDVRESLTGPLPSSALLREVREQPVKQGTNQRVGSICIAIEKNLVMSAVLASSSSKVPIPVAERSKARVCGRSLSGVAGSNFAGGMDVCVVLCCTVKDKRQNQDNQDEEVQIKYRDKKSRRVHGCLSYQCSVLR